jgi:uncharacterized Zn finger protein (UPF0148 family)
MIICPNCRAKLGDGSTRCVVCGTPLGGDQVKAETDIGNVESPPEPAKAAVSTPERPEPGTRSDAKGEKAPVAAQASDHEREPPPPDTPQYQQQYGQYHQQPNQSWQYHQTAQSSGNQCPRCYQVNVVYFYADGSAYCSACYYRYYWRRPDNFLDSMTRKLDGVLR